MWLTDHQCAQPSRETFALENDRPSTIKLSTGGGGGGDTELKVIFDLHERGHKQQLQNALVRVYKRFSGARGTKFSRARQESWRSDSPPRTGRAHFLLLSKLILNVNVARVQVCIQR